MAGKHSPNRFANYQEAHETVMAQLRRGGFVVTKSITFIATAYLRETKRAA